MSWVYLNNGFVRDAEARLSYMDLAFQRGYGIFEFFRTINGRPLFLPDHLARFYYSAEQMHLPVFHSSKVLSGIVEELIAANHIIDSGIRITLTGGDSPDGFNIGSPNLVIAEQPFRPLSPEQVQAGIRLVTYPYQRPLSHVKSIDYTMAVWLQPYMKQQLADDLLYYDRESISECPRSNFFIIDQNNTVLTPGERILKGITRKHLLQLAGENLQAKEKSITPEEARQAKEAFVTSTTKVLLPVTHIDGQQIGTGRPGRFTLQLRDSMEAYIRSL